MAGAGGEARREPAGPSFQREGAPRPTQRGGGWEWGGGLPVCLGPGRLSKGEQEGVDSELAGLSELWVEGGGWACGQKSNNSPLDNKVLPAAITKPHKPRG